MFENQTAINVFENKLAFVDDELVSTDGKQRLINEDFDGLHQNPERFPKSWAFFALKFVVLLLLVIGGCVGASYWAHWNGFDWPDGPGPCFTPDESELAVALMILFGIALFSMLANWFLRMNGKNSTFWTAFVTLMVHEFRLNINNFKDLSLSVLTAVTLIFPTAIFTVISISEHRWFWPKFAQFGGNGTEQLFKQIFDSYRDSREAASSYLLDYYSSNYNEWTYNREFGIKVHLITDPFNAIFSMFALLLNVVIAICLVKMIHRWNLWAPFSKDYKSRHPNCTKLEQMYSKHWLLKDIQWFFPAIVFFAFPCFNLANFFSTKAQTIVGLGFMAILFLLQSVLYHCKVRLQKEENANGLMAPFVMDCAACMGAIFYFLIIWNCDRITEFQAAAYVIGTLIYGYSLARNAWYFWKHGNCGQPLKLNLPNVSIQINFHMEEVNPKNEENNGNVEKVSEKQKDTVYSEQDVGKKMMEV